MGVKANLLILTLLVSMARGQSGEKAVIVGFKKMPGASEKALIRNARGSIRRCYNLIPAMTAVLPETEIARLKSNSTIAYVEENAVYRAAARAWRWRSVAAAPAAGGDAGTARALARIVDVMQVARRHRVAVEAHDRVGQPGAFVGLDPGLDRAAGKQQPGEGYCGPGGSPFQGFIPVPVS